MQMLRTQIVTARCPDSASQSGQKLYFAYGSNLSFKQMAKRCPQSCFVGRARLFQYKFQINERGFANVVKASDPQFFVDGLCYRLTASDEALLDRAEGVPTAYIKKELEVDFFPASPALLGRDLTDLVCRPVSPGPAFRSLSLGQGQTQEVLQSELQGRGEVARVMVYLSTKYVKPGRPWDEYIQRMELGLQEALRLGISNAYVENDVRPSLNAGKGVRGGNNVSSSSSPEDMSKSRGGNPRV